MKIGSITPSISRWPLILLSLALAASPVWGISQTALKYKVTYVGPVTPPYPEGGFAPFSLNDNNQLAGLLTIPKDNVSHAAIWKDGRVQDVGANLALPKDSSTECVAINRYGQMAGGLWNTKLRNNVPCLFDKKNATILTDKFGGGIPSAINDAGTIVGTLGPFDGIALTAFVYQKGKLQTATYGVFNAINQLGLIVGGKTSGPGSGDTQAATYSGGRWTVLNGTSSLNTSNATSVNDQGWIVGTFLGQNNGYFLYKDGQFIDLKFPGGAGFQPVIINNQGQIIANQEGENDPVDYWPSIAYFYENGVWQELDALIDSNSGWYIYEADGINNSGVILAKGYFRGRVNGYVLMYPGK